jgi:hypothetical protein
MVSRSGHYSSIKVKLRFSVQLFKHMILAIRTRNQSHIFDKVGNSVRV